jgi:hypothetical protein
MASDAALEGTFARADSVTAAQQFRRSVDCGWLDGPAELGRLFTAGDIVEVRDRPPVAGTIDGWGPDDRSDKALASGRWVPVLDQPSADTPTQLRFVRPGNQHSYSTLDARHIAGTAPFEAWRTVLASLLRPRPIGGLDELMNEIACGPTGLQGLDFLEPHEVDTVGRLVHEHLAAHRFDPQAPCTGLDDQDGDR